MSVKTTISYIVVFLLGGALSFATFSGGNLATEDLQGRLSLDRAKQLELDKERGERKEPDDKIVRELKEITFIKPNKEGNNEDPQPNDGGNNVCSISNCDLMDRLEQIHSVIGSPTYTLTSILETIHSNTRELYFELNATSRALHNDILTSRFDADRAHTDITELIKGLHGDQTSWTLTGLARHIYAQNANSTNAIKGPQTSWTLTSIAELIDRSCNQ